MDPITAGLAMGGTSILGSYLTTQMTNQANQAMVNQQENYQTQMSDTSYQRAVTDMKAAGINPMLAATNGGASTPPGASAPMTAPNFSGAIATGMDTAIGLRKQNNDLNLQDSQIGQADANTENIEKDSELKEAQKSLMSNQINSSAKDVEAKSMSNQIMSKTLDSQIKKANAEGNYAEINQLMGIINSGASSASSLISPLKLLQGK